MTEKKTNTKHRGLDRTWHKRSGTTGTKQDRVKRGEQCETGGAATSQILGYPSSLPFLLFPSFPSPPFPHSPFLPSCLHLPPFLTLPAFLFLSSFPWSETHPLKPAKESGKPCVLPPPPRESVQSPAAKRFRCILRWKLGLWWAVTTVLKRFTDDELLNFNYKSQGRPKFWRCRTLQSEFLGCPGSHNTHSGCAIGVKALCLSCRRTADNGWHFTWPDL